MKTNCLFRVMMVALAAIMTSCELDSLRDNPIHGDTGDGLVVEVEEDSSESEARTRTTYSGFSTAFSTGDAVGVYCWNGSSVVAANIPYIRQSDGSWTTAAETRIPYSSSYTYYCYYPYRADHGYTPAASGNADTRFSAFITDTGNKFWKADQSTKANFDASNLLIGAGTHTGSGNRVSFAMKHKRGLAIIGDAVNQWYYTDAAGTKYTATPVFSGTYVPYSLGGTLYYLIKPNVNTTVFGQSLTINNGKYKASTVKLTGTPTYQYSLSQNNGSSWSEYSDTKPSWLTIATNETTGEPTEFLVTTINSTSNWTYKGKAYSIRNVPGDAALKTATSVANIDLSMVNNAGVTRSSRTTANCYLVHAPGTYKIPLVYGNAIKNGATNTLAYQSNTAANDNKRDNLVNHADANITNPWIKNHGITVNGASLVWQDVEGMISAVGINGDYLTFTIDPEKIAEGNAVIAAKSGSTIVWSWHIWVTTQTLSNTTTINTGSHTYHVAPVNLGQVNGVVANDIKVYEGELCKIRATSNNVTVEFQVKAKDYYNYNSGSTAYNESAYYQWGRKDPECPYAGAFDSSGTYIGKPTVITGAYSIGQVIQNPEKHYCNNTESRNSVYNEYKANYWDINNIYDNWKNYKDIWNITTATIKTVYDPCPPGFCVPTSNLFYYMANGSSRNDTNWDVDNKGKTWTLNGSNLFFPAGGRRLNNTGGVTYSHSRGWYWSAGVRNCLYFVQEGNAWNVGPSSTYESEACTIRPVVDE